MKQLTLIFQALLGIAALIGTALAAAGRLACRTIRNWWKNRSLSLRRFISAVAIFIPTGFVALIAHAYYQSEYGRKYRGDKSISKNVEIHAFQNHKYRIYNRGIKQYTTPKINWISETAENDSLAVYAIPNKRGYININTGEVIIDAERNNYRKAWIFSEGVAAVVKDGKIGFINAKNEMVIPFRFDYADQCRIADFSYLFLNGYCMMTNKEGLVGLIDVTGQWVVEPVFDEIGTPLENGYRILVKDEKYGVINAQCNTLYPTEYDYIDILSDGFILTKEGKKWQVDSDGNVVKPFLFDGTYYLNYPVGYDECGGIKYAFADFLKYEVMNRYGIMNRITGEPVTPAIYSDINMLSKDLLEVQDSESYDWYLLDINGDRIVEK